MAAQLRKLKNTRGSKPSAETSETGAVKEVQLPEMRPPDELAFKRRLERAIGKARASEVGSFESRRRVTLKGWKIPSSW